MSSQFKRLTRFIKADPEPADPQPKEEPKATSKPRKGIRSEPERLGYSAVDEIVNGRNYTPSGGYTFEEGEDGKRHLVPHPPMPVSGHAPTLDVPEETWDDVNAFLRDRNRQRSAEVYGDDYVSGWDEEKAYIPKTPMGMTIADMFSRLRSYDEQNPVEIPEDMDDDDDTVQYPGEAWKFVRDMMKAMENTQFEDNPDFALDRLQNMRDELASADTSSYDTTAALTHDYTLDALNRQIDKIERNQQARDRGGEPEEREKDRNDDLFSAQLTMHDVVTKFPELFYPGKVTRRAFATLVDPNLFQEGMSTQEDMAQRDQQNLEGTGLTNDEKAISEYKNKDKKTKRINTSTRVLGAPIVFGDDLIPSTFGDDPFTYTDAMGQEQFVQNSMSDSQKATAMLAFMAATGMLSPGRGGKSKDNILTQAFRSVLGRIDSPFFRVLSGKGADIYEGKSGSEQGPDSAEDMMAQLEDLYGREFTERSVEGADMAKAIAPMVEGIRWSMLPVFADLYDQKMGKKNNGMFKRIKEAGAKDYYAGANAGNKNLEKVYNEFAGILKNDPALVEQLLGEGSDVAERILKAITSGTYEKDDDNLFISPRRLRDSISDYRKGFVTTRADNLSVPKASLFGNESEGTRPLNERLMQEAYGTLLPVLDKYTQRYADANAGKEFVTPTIERAKDIARKAANGEDVTPQDRMFLAAVFGITPKTLAGTWFGSPERANMVFDALGINDLGEYMEGGLANKVNTLEGDDYSSLNSSGTGVMLHQLVNDLEARLKRGNTYTKDVDEITPKQWGAYAANRLGKKRYTYKNGKAKLMSTGKLNLIKRKVNKAVTRFLSGKGTKDDIELLKQYKMLRLKDKTHMFSQEFLPDDQIERMIGGTKGWGANSTFYNLLGKQGYQDPLVQAAARIIANEESLAKEGKRDFTVEGLTGSGASALTAIAEYLKNPNKGPDGLRKVTDLLGNEEYGGLFTPSGYSGTPSDDDYEFAYADEIIPYREFADPGGDEWIPQLVNAASGIVNSRIRDEKKAQMDEGQKKNNMSSAQYRQLVKEYKRAKNKAAKNLDYVTRAALRGLTSLPATDALTQETLNAYRLKGQMSQKDLKEWKEKWDEKEDSDEKYKEQEDAKIAMDMARNRINDNSHSPIAEHNLALFLANALRNQDTSNLDLDDLLKAYEDQDRLGYVPDSLEDRLLYSSIGSEGDAEKAVGMVLPFLAYTKDADFSDAMDFIKDYDIQGAQKDLNDRISNFSGDLQGPDYAKLLNERSTLSRYSPALVDWIKERLTEKINSPDFTSGIATLNPEAELYAQVPEEEPIRQIVDNGYAVPDYSQKRILRKKKQDAWKALPDADPSLSFSNLADTLNEDKIAAMTDADTIRRKKVKELEDQKVADAIADAFYSDGSGLKPAIMDDPSVERMNGKQVAEYVERLKALFKDPESKHYLGDLYKKMKEIHQAEDKAFTSRTSGEISEEEYRELMKGLEAEKARINASIQDRYISLEGSKFGVTPGTSGKELANRMFPPYTGRYSRLYRSQDMQLGIEELMELLQNH